MICPFCAANDDRVIDSRSTDGSHAVRRRRICNHCGKRFTTYERVEEHVRLMVIKSDGARQVYDPGKILTGLEAACGKRPVAAAQKQKLVDEVEELLYKEYDREVPAKVIGEYVAELLRLIDEVAYVRFASEYKKFQDVDQFIEEARATQQRANEELPGQGDLFGEVT